MTNKMELLEKRLTKSLPASARLEIDAPKVLTGPWFLDVRLNEKAVVVEWRAKLGFGISTAPHEGYGDGADEVIKDTNKAAKRVISILMGEAKQARSRALPLRGVRELRRVLQQDLADNMGIRQATLASIEKGTDIKIGTLSRYAAALGGKLVIQVEFDDTSVRVATPKVATRRPVARKPTNRRTTP